MIVIPSRAVAVRLGGAAPVTLASNRVAVTVEHVDEELPAPTTDADSDAYLAALAALGISDPTISAASDVFCVAVKDAGVWPKLDAVYLIAGGTAAAHALNLKDPRDLDAAFRLTWNGGWTHTANGAQPDGLSGTYADTHWSPSANATDASCSLGFYSRTAGGTAHYDMGSDDGTNHTLTSVINRYSDGNAYFGIGKGGGGTEISAVNADGRGHYIANRLSETTTEGYKNGVVVTSKATTPTLPPQTCYLGAIHFGGAAIQFANNQYAAAHLGQGLTAQNAADLTTAVQAFQTALSRQV